MKKILLLLFVFVCFSSFEIHKFYTAIYQIEFVAKKKTLQITSRIFVDDLNEAIGKKYNKKVFLGSEKEAQSDVELLKKYLSEKFILKVNGQAKTMVFVSKEIEDNVLICYLKINDILKIKTLEVENSVIMEVHDEQQNIIQANYNGQKHSLLLTSETIKGMLK